MKNTFVVLSFLLLAGCAGKETKNNVPVITINTNQGTSLLGTPLTSKQPDPAKDSVSIANYLAARDNYEKQPNSADALIWYGRRTAYLGDYQKAIEIYTEGIKKFPDDARMYRHRGHRYISTRQLDKAIADFKQAAKLIEGTEDQIEPDGIPNARNTPVSTLHNNIWYHLGLAYYLKDEMDKALEAFNKCLQTSKNPDMVVASSNWLYMILRRLDRNDEAQEVLVPITKELDVFENMAYHNLLLFYKGEISESDLLKGGKWQDGFPNAAIGYGLGNWYFYNGQADEAKAIFKKIITDGSWASFGYISAEADLSRMSNE